jgi:energy-coupling factor transporter ATP-binding protein EcfA2
MSILLIEQNVRKALKMGDRVAVMKAGAVILEAAPTELAWNFTDGQPPARPSPRVPGLAMARLCRQPRQGFIYARFLLASHAQPVR